MFGVRWVFSSLDLAGGKDEMGRRYLLSEGGEAGAGIGIWKDTPGSGWVGVGRDILLG